MAKRAVLKERDVLAIAAKMETVSQTLEVILNRCELLREQLRSIEGPSTPECQVIAGRLMDENQHLLQQAQAVRSMVRGDPPRLRPLATPMVVASHARMLNAQRVAGFINDQRVAKPVKNKRTRRAKVARRKR